MTNIYQAPKADLTERTVPFAGGGSIEKGIAGDYEFSIRAIIAEAWDKTSGSKGTFWLAFLFYILVMFAVMMASGFVFGLIGMTYTQGDPIGKMIAWMFVSQVVQMALILPLGLGFFMIGLKRASGATVGATEIFGYYPKTLSLLGTMILMYLMVAVGLLLLVLPGIYLMVAYALAMPLVVEKNLSPWQALEASRKAVTHRWFRFVGLSIVVMLITFVAMIPLGVGLIWAYPMMMLVAGIVYRNIFGYEGSVAIS